MNRKINRMEFEDLGEENIEKGMRRDGVGGFEGLFACVPRKG